ncbi:adt-1 [Symbiodinium sp. CCMP2456]|nr:adt-1 [Symbiodinium sp. CCMP2456]
MSCVWSQWGSWGRCSLSCGSGRYERMRRIERRSDPGGLPCSGASLENGACNNGPCQPTDCRLGDWSSWSECDVLHPQRFRRRNVEVAPSNGGRACDKYLIQTVPCFAPNTAGQDCDIGMWSQWSDCSKTCGGGQMSRKRQLLKPNTEGGFCHHAVLQQAEPCGTDDCRSPAPNDCIFEHWGAWSDCDALCGKGTRERTRKIAVFATGDGRGCEGATQQLSECELQTCEVVDCQWSEWWDWSVCSASCDGGTKRRERNVAVAPQHGGSLCFPKDKSQIAPCNTESCDAACLDGEWSEWSGWTDCSATCGTAYKSRRRDVAVQPSHCGKPAVGLREEYKACIDMAECNVVQDCVMGEWNHWSQCSCSCFGIRERNRVIERFATEGGESCNGTVKEVVPCNPDVGREPIDQCGANRRRQDCVMSDWEQWSECTASCGGGQTERSRHIVLSSAYGGTPCSGELAEIDRCSEEPCPESGCHDCTWGAWSHWGSCSKCGGQRFRFRNIQQMPNHCGRPCKPMDAKEAGACHSKCENPLFCAWTYWSTSESCDKCGTTSTTRNRALGLTSYSTDFLFMASDEASCAGTQLNVSACPIKEECQTCVAENCEFGAWSEWHDPTCLGLCERHRVISQHNNNCGVGCTGPTLETKTCPVVCQQEQDCNFGDWSEWEGCQSTMGGIVSLQMDRSRDIVKMPMNGGTPCSGEMTQTKACPKIPQNCILGPWSSWSTCSTRCVTGWHTRERVVDQQARHGGEPCAGPLLEIEPCPGADETCRASGKEDCKWASWEQWSHCGLDGQMSRKRTIARLPSVFGEACAGPILETASCDSERVDCDVSPWSAWDACDRSCDGGQTHRHREVHRYPSGGGADCPSILIETKGCNSQSCSGHDCRVSEWESWGFCSTTCGVGQRTRSRQIVGLRGVDGHGCYEALGEVQACSSQVECAERDCVWGEWAAWSYCSRSCDGGIRSRKRHVLKVPSKHGRQCDAEIKETIEPCNTHTCSAPDCTDGYWSHWSDWSPCSVSCDRGTTFRTRQVAKSASECGDFPAGLSTETRICEVSTACVPNRDCVFGLWSAWGPCSDHCDGMQERARSVKHFGLGHGSWCSGATKELRPCNPKFGHHPPPGCRKDHPVDCVVGQWAHWSRCTAVCDGGVQRRTRVVVQRASHGGRGCLAALSEVHECNRHLCSGGNLPVDCEVGQWQEWGLCSKCDGERSRFRTILRYASNGGRPCDHMAVREVGKCPRSCSSNLYCTWAGWQDWGDCSKTCGRGGKRRRRRYLHLSHDAGAELLPGGPGAPGQGGIPPGPGVSNGGYPTLQEQLEPTTTREAAPAFVNVPPTVHPEVSPLAPVPTLPGLTVHAISGEYEVMVQRSQELESTHVKDLLLSFVGGFMSISFLIAVSGMARPRPTWQRPVSDGAMSA